MADQSDVSTGMCALASLSDGDGGFHSSDDSLRDVCRQLNSSGGWITWLVDMLGENYITSIITYQICQGWGLMPKSVVDDMLISNLIREWDSRFGRYWWFNAVAINERIKIQRVYNMVRRIDTAPAEEQQFHFA